MSPQELSDFENDLARLLMRQSFRTALAEIDSFLQERADRPLPAAFQIGGAQWEAAEAEIGAAAQGGNWTKVNSLGEAYVARVRRYLDAWRAQLAE